MTAESDRLLAAHYVLGLLEPSERAHVRARAAYDSGFATLLGRQMRLFAGPADADAEPPPARLLEEIEARIDGLAGVPGATTIRHDEGQWHPLLPGVAVKLLTCDEVGGRLSYLVSMAPGARLPAHHHNQIEECVMISGALIINGLRVEAGDFHMIPAGIAHPELVAPEGALFHVRGEFGLRLAEAGAEVG